MLETIKTTAFRKAYAARFSDEKDKPLAGFILSDQFPTAVERLKNGEDILIPPEHILIPKEQHKFRNGYRYDVKTKAILGAINEALHRYDSLLSACSYSQAKKRGQGRCIADIKADKNVRDSYICALDITRFAESLDCEVLDQAVDRIVSDDPACNALLHRLLHDRRYFDHGVPCLSETVVTLGNPLQAFWEDLYLNSFDHDMEERAVSYYRYFDDILFLAEDASSLTALRQFAETCLSGLKLQVNPSKVQMAAPGEALTFLGCRICNGEVEKTAMIQNFKRVIDLRRVRALKLKRKYALSDIRAMEVFLTSLRFFREGSMPKLFRTVNDADVIRETDAYLIDALRQVGSGKKTGAKYRVRYEDMKKAGYHSLVNAYYKYVKSKPKGG